MAFHHHHHHPTNHHQTTTTTTCHCCSQPYPPPTQPPYLSLPTDPHLLTTLLTLLQTPQHQTFQDSNFHQTNKNPSRLTQNQRHPHHKSPQDALLTTLLERIGALEAAFHSLSLTSSSSSCCSSSSSSSSPLSLREAAARIIQTHFRTFLVRRSRTLRELKELASVKSSLSCLKLSFSRNGFVDFDSISKRALDLLLHLDSIQSGDQMIRDSKRSITREIVQFLDLVDGACVKRHQISTRAVKNVRLVRSDNRTANGYGRDVREHATGSKCRNSGSNDKKLIANLRDRVERISRLSKALENEEEDEGGENYKTSGDGDDGVITQIANGYPLENGESVKRHGMHSNAKKRVCFVENGDVIRVYDIDRNIRGTSPVLEEIEHSVKGRQDEEAHSDGEQSSQCSEDVKNGTSDELSEDQDDNNEFTFPAPEPAKMEGRPRLMTSKPGVKIVG